MVYETGSIKGKYIFGLEELPLNKVYSTEDSKYTFSRISIQVVKVSGPDFPPFLKNAKVIEEYFIETRQGKRELRRKTKSEVELKKETEDKKSRRKRKRKGERRKKTN